MKNDLPSNRTISVRYLAQAGLIAAVYVVLTLVFAPISFSAIQVRISEVLTILPIFLPSAIPGLFLGCLISNLLGSGLILADIIGGSLVTLVAACLTYLLRKKSPWLAPVPPIICNALVIPFILYYGYGFVDDAIPFMMLTVGIGQVIACGVLGMAFYFSLKKLAPNIFHSNNS